MFAKCWFWTFANAYRYATIVGRVEGWNFFVDNFSKVFLSAISLWILSAGLTSFLRPYSTQSRHFAFGSLVFLVLSRFCEFVFRWALFHFAAPSCLSARRSCC